MGQENESRGVAGCLVVPIVAAVALLGGGVWMLTRWGELTGLMKFAAVVMTAGGGGVLAIVGLLVAALLALRRAGRAMKRDAKSLVWSAKYMLRVGRPEAASRASGDGTGPSLQEGTRDDATRMH